MKAGSHPTRAPALLLLLLQVSCCGTAPLQPRTLQRGGGGVCTMQGERAGLGVVSRREGAQLRREGAQLRREGAQLEGGSATEGGRERT